MKVSVIIPAAGSAVRFGGTRSKIFQDLSGEPVFLRTLGLFAGRDDVCQIQLVLAARDIKAVQTEFATELAPMGVSLVEGGSTRAESVRNALAGVCGSADLVCVHDAVRPCVPPERIDAVFGAAGETGAAILAWRVHGTLKRVGPDKTIEATVPRENLWQAQTPQVFATDVLVKAYQADVGGVTDDAQLVESGGHPVTIVPGDPRNIKITTPADLVMAAAILNSVAD